MTTDIGEIERNKNVVLELLENWVDPDVFDRVTTDDFELVVEADPAFISVAGAQPKAQALAARRAMAGVYTAVMNIRSVTAEDDRVVVDLITDSRIKDAHGIDRPYVNRVCFVCRLRDGKISEVREYGDSAYCAETFPDLYKAPTG
ncbi:MULTISPECIES: nuclear transport factor 2 family protein [unclassified Mycobacterium]|uniref:nuclear transport factor 2 family protein n=1 Tax=unclassified Mycobacterium TaxID=2642494 RepID=UPI0029C80BA8|nr:MULTISPECIES: nuclear transport factor 2 family protein [unclassified Mycobacterium]